MSNVNTAYETELATAKALLAQLQALVQNPTPSPLHYGHVGDLCRMNTLLRQALGQE